jgi:hypothetical protein
VTWDAARMKITCYPLEVRYLTLTSGADVPTGLYSDLVKALPKFFKDRGVLEFTASPGTPQSETILRRRGSWDGAMRWRL